MLYVRVEIWPYGDRSRARLLQEMTISNTGGDSERGDYRVQVSAPDTKLIPESVWKSGEVKRHDRSLSPFALVRTALTTLGV